MICDSSSVCIAHDLTSTTTSGVVDTKWRYAWVMNWGNSGYTITMYKNHNGILHRLNMENKNTNPQQQVVIQHNPNLSTKCIQILLQQYIIQQFLQKNRLSLMLSNKITSNTKAMYKLHIAIEDTLRTFVRMSTVNVHIDSFYDGMDLNLSVSRPKLDMLMGNVYKWVNYMISTNQQLFKEKVGVDSIDVVLVSGSGFQMPNMDKMLESLFPKSQIIMNTSSNSNNGNATNGNNIPCDEVVATGCAKYAYQILYHDYFTKENNDKYNIEDNEEYDSSTTTMNVPVCPFHIGIAYCNDGKTDSFTLVNDDGTISDSWTIVSFMDDDSTILPFVSTKSISFSDRNEEEIPCTYYIIQQTSDDTTTTTPLAKITIKKEDITKDQMLHVCLDIDKNYDISFILKNTGECISL